MIGIKQLIFEGDLEEAAKSVQEIEQQNLALFVYKGSTRMKAVLYSPEQVKKVFDTYPVFTDHESRRKAIQDIRRGVVFGVFTANYESPIDAYEVDTVAAEHSYGPFMYDLLSSLGGWIVRDTVGITNAAKKIWTYIFTKRNDWDREFLPEDYRETLPRKGNKSNRKNNPLNYKYKIQIPVPVENLMKKHNSFVSSINEPAKEVENTISAFGSLYFEKMYSY